MNSIIKFNNTFEGIKHIDESNEEYWYAKELQGILEYTTWKTFEKPIEKAKIACNLVSVKLRELFHND